MSRVAADRSGIGDPEAIARVRGNGSFPAVLALLLAGSLAVFGVIATRASEPIGLTVLAALACLGIFFLFGIAARLIRVGSGDGAPELYAAVFNSLDHGVLLTETDGRAVFANAKYESLFGRDALGDINPLEVVFAGQAESSRALFRLARGSERGERVVEEVCIPSADDGSATKHFRVTAEAAARTLRPAGAPRLVLWQVQDLTEIRHAETERMERAQVRLERFERLGLGTFVCAEDGSVHDVNGQLSEWLRLSQTVGRRPIQLGDLVAEDGLALVQSFFGREDSVSERVDVDLVREDGIRWPASLTVTNREGSLLVGVLERISDVQSPRQGSAEVRFAKFFQTAPFGIALVGADGVIESANSAFGRLLVTGGSVRGQQAVDVLGRGCEGDIVEGIQSSLQAALAGKANVPPLELAAGAQGQFTRQVFMTSVGRGRNAKGVALLYVLDATEQKALELKYAQSQKMEAVGKLAGGIAHDFNNVLTVIIGFSDLLLGTHRPSDPAYKNISSIKSSANRAARMVKQLLAFSRRQTLQPEVLEVGECLTDVSVLLKRLLGEEVELVITPGRNVWPIKADRTQLEQVIFNLAANARDAMSSGGQLQIKTSNVSERESRKLESKGMVRGQYVAIEVTDTGSGMSQEVLEKIFEPFFTTKDVGKGTGLGLATVYGIVKQTGGYVYADSTVGQGTTFRIYLPRCVTEADEAAEGVPDGAVGVIGPESGDITGAGKVLVVEDEDGVRSFAVQALERKGYDVVEACDGVEALELLEESNFEFDLVLSDVKMPEMDGPTLLKEARIKRPDLKFIFVSGYADDAFAQTIDPEADFSFLSKPYTLAQIAAEVKRRLGK